jgi:hypothetical protein
MSYSENDTVLKIRNSKEAIMFKSWKDHIQDRRVSPVKPIMIRSWKDRFQFKMLNSKDECSKVQHIT